MATAKWYPRPGVTIDGTAMVITGFVPTSDVGIPGGVASLDGGGKVPVSQLPSLAINEIFPVASQAAMLALVAERGDVAIRTDLDDQWFMLSSDSPSTLADWLEITTGSVSGGGTRTSTTITTAALASEAQETGSIVVSKGTVLFRAVAIFNRQCRIRLYGTSAARDADAARPTDESAISGSLGNGTGIAVDLVLSEDDAYAIDLDPKAILGSPADPPVTTLYYTIDNLTSGTVVVSVTLYHTPIET